MIKAQSDQPAYRTIVATEHHRTIVDAPIAKGGAGDGFDPHELLEAALAACINIVVRKRAAQLNIAVESVVAFVQIDRSRDDVAVFECELQMGGAINAEQHALLLAAAKTCPVSQTLAKRIEIDVKARS